MPSGKERYIMTFYIYRREQNRKRGKSNMSLQEYIESRELSLLWIFNGTTYYEDQMGKVISLQEIERQFYDSLTA